MKKILKALYILLFISIAVFCFYKAYEIKEEQTKIKEEQTELIDIAEIPEKVKDIEEKKEEINFQDLKVLYELIKKEINNNDPSHLTKFATCEILYDTKGKIEEFINYAKILYQTKIIPSFDDNDKFAIFSVNNRMEDLESLIDDESFYAVYYITLEKIRSLYAKINGIIDLPIMKIEKIYNDKKFAKKYIASSSHSLPSQEFIDLYLECIKLDNRNIMLCNLKRLYGYSFGNLDFDPKCFCLRFEKKSPFRV